MVWKCWDNKTNFMREHNHVQEKEAKEEQKKVL